MSPPRAGPPAPVAAVLAGLGFALLAIFAVARFAPGPHPGALVAGLFGVGGFLAGLVAWGYGSRLAAAARSAAASIWVGVVAVPATIVAALVTGHVADALGDPQGPAAFAVVAAVYGLSGVAVAVGGLALVGLWAGVAAARRRGETARSALLAVSRPAIAGLALAATFAVALLLHRVPLSAQVLELAGATAAHGVPVRPSAWIEREKRLFTAALSGAECEVLVVPFEAPGHSVDRPGRSLMTRAVAAAIARQGLCVIDPTLAARALGVQARTHEWRDIAPVATAVGARWLVRGEVALDPQRRAFTLDLHLYERADPRSPWREPRAVSAGAIAFSDDLPPEAAFAPRAAALVGELGLPTRAAQVADPQRPAARAFPANSTELSADPGNALDRAERLQLLALAHAPWDVNAEQLWERSLVAVADAADRDEAARVVAARANLHLYRRPYAVKLVERLDSPEARALAALADGNLPEAERRLGAVQNPSAALIGALELERLRALYGSGATAGFDDRRKEVLARHPAYAALLFAPLSSGDWFHMGVHELVGRDLAALDADLARSEAQSIARVFLSVFFGGDVDAFGLVPGAIERSYGPVWERHGRAWRAARAFDRVAPWDLYDALYAANRAALVRTVAAVRGHQGLPKVALRVTDQLDAVFRDHPRLHAETALAMHKLADNAPAARMDAVQWGRIQRRAREVYAWEGGETPASDAIDGLIDAGAFYADEPPRPWRPPPWDRGDRFAATRLDAKRAQASAAHYLRAVEYTQHELWYLERAYEYVRQVGGEDEGQRLIAANEHRFVGHFRRAKLVAARAATAPDQAGAMAALERAVQAQPEEWSGHYELAHAQLRGRQPEAAQRTLLAFPGFQRDSQHRVALSNHAHDGGILLLRAGEGELARPLLERAIAYRTGSGAEMWSGLRLAMLEGDYRRARDWGESLHRRYQDAWGLTDVAILSFLMDDAATGWQRFAEASQKHPGSIPFEAAFAGHRMAGTDRDGLVAFAGQWQLKSGPPQFEALLREHFLVNMLLVDRAADERALAAMRPFLGKGGDRAFALFAPAYLGFKRGDYAASVQPLRELNDALVNVSVNQKRAVSYPLPYVTLALARSGNGEAAEALVRSFRERVGPDFYFLLARAYLDGLAGRGEASREHLWEAFVRQPPLDDLPIQPPFQLLEACERLFELTGDDAYRKLLVDLARRTQVRWPWSWAYAVEAKHGTEPDARRRALALALYLDRHSERLAGVAEAERRAAETWLAQSNPFRTASR